MGMPISFDLLEDEVRTKLCTAPDCRCPDCHQRRLIRLGSLITHQHRYSRTGQMGGIHAGYIFTDLPDYRFRHALSAESRAQAASRDNGPEGTEARATTTTTTTATTTAAALNPEAPAGAAVTTSTTSTTNASSTAVSARRSVTAIEDTTTTSSDVEQQERCDDEEGTAHGRDRDQRVRAQAWATNVEGLDYYHESDQDS
ncbi:hypothetical protein BGZ72_008526 [Mortierella alpina]|nr:hypothetical protein BGZ72_008526 [Mortierella alpina]